MALENRILGQSEIDQIKKNARKSVDEGAVTEDYALDLGQACHLLNQALATEILCVLRYRHHQIIAKSINFPQVAAEFKEHAESEEKHVMMLAERIDQLGGDPDFNPKSAAEGSATDFGTAKDLMGMIREDLIAERVVIEVYRKMILWFGDKDSTTRRLLESILEDEEEHANDLSDLLAPKDPPQHQLS